MPDTPLDNSRRTSIRAVTGEYDTPTSFFGWKVTARIAQHHFGNYFRRGCQAQPDLRDSINNASTAEFICLPLTISLDYDRPKKFRNELMFWIATRPRVFFSTTFSIGIAKCDQRFNQLSSAYLLCLLRCQLDRLMQSNYILILNASRMG